LQRRNYPAGCNEYPPKITIFKEVIMTFQQHLYVCGFALIGLVCLAGCPPPAPGPDTTPPTLNPVIQLGTPPPDNTNNGISIAAADVNRSGIPKDIAIRLIAPAVDAESKVTSFMLESNLTWQCAFGHGSETQGIVQNAPLVFLPAITTIPNSTVQNFDGVVDPIAMTGCSTAKPGWGPVNVRGFVRVVATNGAGLTTKSFTFLFDYQDVGSL
jgi:hypothetical protein